MKMTIYSKQAHCLIPSNKSLPLTYIQLVNGLIDKYGTPGHSLVATLTLHLPMVYSSSPSRRNSTREESPNEFIDLEDDISTPVRPVRRKCYGPQTHDSLSDQDVDVVDVSTRDDDSEANVSSKADKKDIKLVG